MKNKKNIIILVTCILVIALVVIAFFVNKNYKNVHNEENKIVISISNKENEEIYNKEITVRENIYLSNVLEEIGDIDIIMEDSQYGKYITSMLGISQGDGYYWSYYINGEYADVGISSCKIKNNSLYSFKIEKFEY